MPNFSTEPKSVLHSSAPLFLFAVYTTLEEMINKMSQTKTKTSIIVIF